MKLTDLLTEQKESKQDFFDRSYWNGSTEKGSYWGDSTEKVLIWLSPTEMHDPRCRPDKILNLEEARRYIETLPERSVSEGDEVKENGNRLG